MVQPSEELYPALVRLKRALRQSGQASGEGIERTQMHILALVKAQAGLRYSEISKEICIDLSTASRHCADLVQAGYLERRDDPKDRRAGLLFITDKGRFFIDQLIDHHKSILNSALAQWSEADKEMLIALVDRLGTDLSLNFTTTN